MRLLHPLFLLVACVPSVLLAKAVVLDPQAEPVAPISHTPTVLEQHQQLRELQEQLSRLQGDIELLTHRLTQLESQSHARYSDLDSRLETLTRSNTRPTPEVGNQAERSRLNVRRSVRSSTPPVEDEQTRYQAAYALVEQRDFEAAQQAFDEFLKVYPRGLYAANAHYWLGEIHLAQHHLSLAVASFETVISDFPDHAKAADALLKLGYAYQEMGRLDDAKSIYQQVISRHRGTTLERLAATRLARMES